jgi:hypothetical protein
MASVAFVISLLRSGRLRARFAMLWMAVGSVLIVLAAFPSVLDWTAERLGIVYPPAVFLLAGTSFLLFVAVQFSWEISRLEERTRVLAEEVALLRERMDADPAAPPPPAPPVAGPGRVG